MKKHTYLELLAAKPEVLKIKGYIEYVENPFFSQQPIIAINRLEKTAIDTDLFEIEDLP